MKKLITFGLGTLIGAIGTFYLIASGSDAAEQEKLKRRIKEKSNEIIK